MEGGSGYFAVEDTSTVRGSSLAEVEFSPGAKQIAVSGHLCALHYEYYATGLLCVISYICFVMICVCRLTTVDLFLLCSSPR